VADAGLNHIASIDGRPGKAAVLVCNLSSLSQTKTAVFLF